MTMRNAWKTPICCVLIFMIVVMLTGCNLFEYNYGKLKSMFNGREAVIQTYDEEGKVIDRIERSSISIGANKGFEITDKDGNVVEKSSVLSITVVTAGL
jgi:hypothetical protein